MSAQSLNPVWLALGVVCAGVSVILIFNTVVGVSRPVFLYYGLLTWAWIRSVDLMNRRLSTWIEDASLRFAVAWLLPIGIVLLMGVMHLTIPVLTLAALGLFDLIIRLVVEIRRHGLVIIKSVLAGFVLATFMAKVIVEEHYPWMDALSPAGIGFIDNYRDAAIVMAWHKYSTISHGVHGLMFEAYHSLSAMFVSPFITEQFGVFSVFVFLSFIAVPSLLVYGISMVIRLAPSPKIAQHWSFFLVLFIFLFSQFDLIFTQSSLMMASLLMIAAIPLLARVWFHRDGDMTASIVILAMLLPMVMFARIFNGLILLSLMAPLAFVVKGAVPRVVLTLSLVASVAIIVLFFGSTVRAESTYFRGLLAYLMRGGYGAWWFLSIWIIILLPLGLFFKAKALMPRTTLWCVIKDPYSGPIIYTCCVTLVLLVRAGSSTDAIYQTVPAFTALFFIFILAPPDLMKKHFPSGGIVDGLEAKGVMYCAVFALTLTLYIENENRIKHQIPFEEHLFTENVNEIASHFGADFTLPDRSQCAAGLARFVCSLRPAMFGGLDIITIANASMPSRLGRAARRQAQSVDGVTGVYISPHHQYWAMQYYRPALPSLYFMSVVGLPMVFGAPEYVKNPAYSIMTSHSAGGTLVPLSDFADTDEFCEAVITVGVDNVVVFEADDEAGYLVQCGNRASSVGKI